jgi:hypothetical protein
LLIQRTQIELLASFELIEPVCRAWLERLGVIAKGLLALFQPEPAFCLLALLSANATRVPGRHVEGHHKGDQKHPCGGSREVGALAHCLGAAKPDLPIREVVRIPGKDSA